MILPRLQRTVGLEAIILEGESWTGVECVTATSRVIIRLRGKCIVISLLNKTLSKLQMMNQCGLEFVRITPSKPNFEFNPPLTLNFLFLEKCKNFNLQVTPLEIT